MNHDEIVLIIFHIQNFFLIYFTTFDTEFVLIEIYWISDKKEKVNKHLLRRQIDTATDLHEHFDWTRLMA